jgi:hypothetical protein
MSTRTPRRLLLAGIVTLAASIIPAASGATAAAPTPGAVPIPTDIPGISALPGPVATASTPADDMGLLKVTPDQGGAGKPLTISGSGLPAGKDVSIQWGTAVSTWQLDARADSIDYLGRKTDKLNVVLATVHTDSSGSFGVKVAVPSDWGGIHDIYAVVDGVQVAKGGFLFERHATISPKKGPIGTMITISYHGLASTLYGGSGAVYYDGHYTGAATGIWTRGTAKVKIRASGPVGDHVIQATGGIGNNYLNIEQSPIPWAVDQVFHFNVTRDNGAPPNRIDWPAKVTPTINQRTTLGSVGLNYSSGTTATLSETSGQVGSKATVQARGLRPGAVQVAWATVVGTRVNCTGTCWSFAQVPLGNATVAADGTLAASEFTVPDNLGGWHYVQLVQNGETVAQVPFYVKRSIVGQSRMRLKAGQHFTIHLKGIGWTQMDNTIAVDYDNSYRGYACGFNSNGDVVIPLIAMGKPGTHLIDMYPLIYTQQPSYANTPYGMVPILSYARDFPGLAAGYQLPAIRMAIEIVK